MRRAGFTLVELMVAVAALGALSLAVALPAIRAASSVEAPGRSVRLAHLLAEEGAQAEADMAAVADADWSATTAAWQASSPFVPHVPADLDGMTVAYGRSVACVDATLAPDPSCAAGYATVTVTVETADGDRAAATFLATPEAP